MSEGGISGVGPEPIQPQQEQLQQVLNTYIDDSQNAESVFAEFQNIDSDSSGDITESEMNAYMQSSEGQETLTYIQEFYNSYGDNNGALNYLQGIYKGMSENAKAEAEPDKPEIKGQLNLNTISSSYSDTEKEQIIAEQIAQKAGFVDDEGNVDWSKVCEVDENGQPKFDESGKLQLTNEFNNYLTNDFYNTNHFETSSDWGAFKAYETVGAGKNDLPKDESKKNGEPTETPTDTQSEAKYNYAQSGNGILSAMAGMTNDKLSNDDRFDIPEYIAPVIDKAGASEQVGEPESPDSAKTQEQLSEEYNNAKDKYKALIADFRDNPKTNTTQDAIDAAKQQLQEAAEADFSKRLFEDEISVDELTENFPDEADIYKAVLEDGTQATFIRQNNEWVLDSFSYKLPGTQDKLQQGEGETETPTEGTQTPGIVEWRNLNYEPTDFGELWTEAEGELYTTNGSEEGESATLSNNTFRELLQNIGKTPAQLYENMKSNQINLEDITQIDNTTIEITTLQNGEPLQTAVEYAQRPEGFTAAMFKDVTPEEIVAIYEACDENGKSRLKNLTATNDSKLTVSQKEALNQYFESQLKNTGTPVETTPTPQPGTSKFDSLYSAIMQRDMNANLGELDSGEFRQLIASVSHNGADKATLQWLNNNQTLTAQQRALLSQFIH